MKGRFLIASVLIGGLSLGCSSLPVARGYRAQTRVPVEEINELTGLYSQHLIETVAPVYALVVSAVMFEREHGAWPENVSALREFDEQNGTGIPWDAFSRLDVRVGAHSEAVFEYQVKAPKGSIERAKALLDGYAAPFTGTVKLSLYPAEFVDRVTRFDFTLSYESAGGGQPSFKVGPVKGTVALAPPFLVPTVTDLRFETAG